MGGRRGPRRHPRTRHPRACPSAGRRGGARASPPRSSSLLRSRSRRAARWLDRDASSAGTGRAIDRTRRPPAATSSSATPRDRSAETRETWWGRFGRVRPGMPVPRALSRAWSSDLYTVFARSSSLNERRKLVAENELSRSHFSSRQPARKNAFWEKIHRRVASARGVSVRAPARVGDARHGGTTADASRRSTRLSCRSCHVQNRLARFYRLVVSSSHRLAKSHFSSRASPRRRSHRQRQKTFADGGPVA